MAIFVASTLLRAARQAAGLSQRELAHRARTSQSVVARIEGGQTDPTAGTLARLLAAAGFTLEAEAVPSRPDPRALDDVQRILSLTPAQRLIEVRNVSRFTNAARRT